MAEYDNSNRIAGWIRESKAGSKYISMSINVDGKEYTAAVFKNDVEEGSNKPIYTGKITPKGEFSPQQSTQEEDAPF